MSVDAAVFDPSFSDFDLAPKPISFQQAESLFIFFRQHPLFNWHDSNNGCEGRADAVCVLLDEWNIPNYKVWIFGGAYLKKSAGQLKQYWNYHVAPVLPVAKDNAVIYYVLDPSTADVLQTVDEWLNSITLIPCNYYAIRRSHWYIFPAKELTTRKWHPRDKRNRKWMIQALAGINALNGFGKSKLTFHKKRLKNIGEAFRNLKRAGESGSR